MGGVSRSDSIVPGAAFGFSDVAATAEDGGVPMMSGMRIAGNEPGVPAAADAPAAPAVPAVPAVPSAPAAPAAFAARAADVGLIGAAVAPAIPATVPGVNGTGVAGALPESDLPAAPPLLTTAVGAAEAALAASSFCLARLTRCCSASLESDMV